MSEIVIAYIPVLHEGYRRFLQSHAGKRPDRPRLPLFLISPEVVEGYRPLKKDIRALDPDLIAKAIRSWDIVSTVTVLTAAEAHRLARETPSITLPDEDVSIQIVERFFPRCEVKYATTFLRWDKNRTIRMLDVGKSHSPELPHDESLAELIHAGETEAAKSIDWWRQVGAAIRLSNGAVLAARNHHLPDELSPYVDGDPRSNFFKGVHVGLSTAVHAEAALIAQAAREGQPTEGATMYVTDFPCPTCAKLIAGAGVKRLLYRQGYAMVDGLEALRSGGVEYSRLVSAGSQLVVDGLD